MISSASHQPRPLKQRLVNCGRDLERSPDPTLSRTNSASCACVVVSSVNTARVVFQHFNTFRVRLLRPPMAVTQRPGIKTIWNKLFLRLICKTMHCLVKNWWQNSWFTNYIHFPHSYLRQSQFRTSYSLNSSFSKPLTISRRQLKVQNNHCFVCCCHCIVFVLWAFNSYMNDVIS